MQSTKKIINKVTTKKSNKLNKQKKNKSNNKKIKNKVFGNYRNIHQFIQKFKINHK